AGATIGLLAAPLTFAEEDRLILGDVEDGELVLKNETATVLDGLWVRGRRIHESLVDGNHRGLRRAAMSYRSQPSTSMGYYSAGCCWSPREFVRLAGLLRPVAKPSSSTAASTYAAVQW